MAKAAASKTQRFEQASSYLEISNVCDIKDIEVYANKAINIAESLLSDKNGKFYMNSIKLIADAYNNIGYGKKQMGNTSEALNYYYKSIGFYEATGDSLIALETYGNLAAIYLEQGDSSKCLRIYKKLFSSKKVCSDPESFYNLNSNVGYFYNKVGNFRKALYYYLNAKKQADILPYQATRYYVNNNIGCAYLNLKMYDSALVYFLPAADFFREDANEETLAWSYNLLGRTYMELSDFNRAEKYFLLAKQLTEKSELQQQLMLVLENLVFVSRNLGKYKEALQYLLQKVKIEKQIVNNENLKKLYQKEAQLEISKNEAITNERIERDRVKSKFLIICLVLSIIIAVVAIRSYVVKRRSNRLLSNQNLIISEQKKEVEVKSAIIVEKQKEIIDSINYAKRIQNTLLAHDEFLQQQLPEHFIFFKPKDIVSGDFYWATKRDSKFYLSVCDSTGHGVPGAFMSLLNIGFLSEAINEKDILEPHKVFDHVRRRLIDNLSKDDQKDGFDGVLLCFDMNDPSLVKLSYAAANNAPILVRNNQIIELDKDRMPVGIGELKQPFKLYEIDLIEGDTLYLYTDGFADQFGGPRGKKFKYKQLNELLLAHSPFSATQQRNKLCKEFDNWRGDLEQVDDVCIVGIKI